MTLEDNNSAVQQKKVKIGLNERMNESWREKIEWMDRTFTFTRLHSCSKVLLFSSTRLCWWIERRDAINFWEDLQEFHWAFFSISREIIQLPQQSILAINYRFFPEINFYFQHYFEKRKNFSSEITGVDMVKKMSRIAIQAHRSHRWRYIRCYVRSEQYTIWNWQWLNGVIEDLQQVSGNKFHRARTNAWENCEVFISEFSRTEYLFCVMNKLTK